MFKVAEEQELNQISLTGVRGIIMVGLLITAPRSLEEIKQAFIELKVMDQNASDDILRIDLNTIKIMGCELSRPSPSNGYRYTIKKHPFDFKISDIEINILKRAYKRLKLKADISTIIKYDELFKKISSRICEDSQREALLGISVLKRYNVSLLKDLMLDCSQNRVLDLSYRKVGSHKDSKKQVVAQNLVFKSDKIYLYCHDLATNEPVVLLVDRLKSVDARHIEKHDFEPSVTKVLFKLNTNSLDEFQDGEVIVENEDNLYTVEGHYHNDFIAAQRILSFGSRCVVLEPVEFKNTIINKLKEMRETYGG